MALLSREDQAKVVRIVSSMIAAGFSLKDTFLSLADDYRDRGLIEVGGTLERYIPKSLLKGYIADRMEEIAEAIERGQKEDETIRESDLFDDDVKGAVASAIASRNLQKMANKLADLLEVEVELLGKLKKVLISPAIGGVVALLFTWVMVFRLVPKVYESVNKPELLPPVVRFAHTVSLHPFIFAVSVIGLVAGTVVFLKSGVWRSYLPAYRYFEKLRFLNWLKILLESGWNEVEVFQFLLESGFSKRWREAVRDGIYNLEAGEHLEKVFEEFYGQKLISSTDFSFIKSGIQTGNIPKQLEPNLKYLSGETDRKMEKASVLIQLAVLSLVGAYVIFLYLGILIPLTTSAQQVM